MGKPESFTQTVLVRIHQEEPDQPVHDVRSMEQRVDRTLQSRKLLTGLVALFSGASLLLACLGLCGVVSYAVELRVREFGIRLALGAEKGPLRNLVLGQAGQAGGLWNGDRAHLGVACRAHPGASAFRRFERERHFVDRGSRGIGQRRNGGGINSRQARGEGGSGGHAAE